MNALAWLLVGNVNALRRPLTLNDLGQVVTTQTMIKNAQAPAPRREGGAESQPPKASAPPAAVYNKTVTLVAQIHN